MIARYTRPAMGRIWSDENRLQIWLEIELAAAEAWAEVGAVPREDALALRRAARVDAARMAELEARTGHDVASFVEAVAETAGPAGRWLHYGLTSSDVVDTALSLQLTQAARLLDQDCEGLLQAVAEQARRWADLPMIGRTHGVHAEPITLGLKLARWHEELKRGRARLAAAAADLRVGQLSGPVGTYAGLDPRVERLVCQRLGLSPAADSTQVLARDRHASFVCALAVLAGSLEYCATEIRGLQRTEARELEEPFRLGGPGEKGQKGSSSMPHKRNPEKCERVAGLARLIRGYAVTALQDQALWHERDISHSSAERVLLPDACIALDYALALFADIVRGLRVYPQAMRANLERTRGLWASGQVLLALIAAGLDRETAYRLVQEHAMATWEDLNGPDFRARLLADPRLPAGAGAAVDRCFDLGHQLRHVPEIMGRLVP
jgi:adenylosuccinate lyase